MPSSHMHLAFGINSPATSDCNISGSFQETFKNSLILLTFGHNANYVKRCGTNLCNERYTNEHIIIIIIIITVARESKSCGEATFVIWSKEDGHDWAYWLLWANTNIMQIQ